MAPLSLKIILDDGAITRTMMFDTTTKVKEAGHIVRDKILTLDPNKEYGFFLASADNDCSGVWLEDGDKTLEYYMLRDGDSLHYLLKIRNLKLRMLDGAVKTLQLDESKKVVELMVYICEKLRISHSEEYGLCREEKETADDSKNATGTLTLKKKTIQRERDAKLEQLSKKLKTDDLVEWLDQHKTLRELKVEPQEMLLFKRRLFYSDRNVDSRDPVQLNLLYVQTRDGILEGKQVVSESTALEFAGLQCQIQFGDYQEEKHKPGFIQNLKEFLPEQYVSWGVEKKTIKEHKKHVGVPEIEAKHLYTKMARALPTYGVTFFLVKEKLLRKKKLVPRLLGINAQSILRLDEETKEIIQVWLLTQVKSYRADYESFALNFGDYSEKEYVVKTNEGFRIKNILEGYIDIIRRSLAAPRKVDVTEGEAMYEENVERSRGTTIQNYAASKMIETSLVGPNQIICVEQGKQGKEGTQILTINELVETNLGNKRQQSIISQQAQLEFNKRQLSTVFEQTMKNFNSKCVTTAVCLSDFTEQNIEKAKETVACLKDALPGIIEGIKETAAKSSPLKSKILLNNLDDLCSYVTNLSYLTKNIDLSNEENLIKAQNAAKKAADLSTQMHLSLDPNTKRRSKILMSSRNSFIQDEKTEASLRRASFLAATDKAWTVVENASQFLDEANETVPSNDECKQLGRKVAYDMGKLQAAIAMILNSHADPDNINYESAIMSMQRLSEIMPIFIQDIKHVTTVGDEETGEDLKKYVRKLLDCTRAMCMLTGSDNVNKMFDVGNDYADVCKKITEIVKKYNINSPDDSYSLNNEIVKLVQNVGSKVQLLLMGTSELTKLEASDPRATELDAAAIKCTDATECLIACARLTLSSIHEPHSKSAITAATENISSSVQNMALLWKNLSEKPDRKPFAKQLANSTFELAKTLDKLRNAFSNIKAIDEESEEHRSNERRQSFIAKAKSADKIISEANVQLQKMSNLPVILAPKKEDSNEHPELKNNLSQNLAHLNAAVAALLQATGESNQSDYDKAETAVEIISKLLPDIIQDSKYLNGQVDEPTWANISKYLKDILEATKDICVNVNESNKESLNDAASQFANASGRLTYIYNPRKKCEKENKVMDLSKSAVDEISQMLARVYDLVETVSRDDGDLLDKAGVKVVAPAQRLLKITEITAPNINEARCQESLLSAIDLVSDEIENLKNTWTPMLQSPEYKEAEEQLNKKLEIVNKTITALREACTENDDAEQQKKQEFTTSMSAAESALEEASRQLQDLSDSRLLTEGEGRNGSPELQSGLSQKLAHLNAAVAALIQATGDPHHSDYVEAQLAINIISQLTPDIIKDSKRLNGQVDQTTWKNIAEYLKDMLNATKDICANADNNESNESKTESLNDAVSQFANASGRLTYIYNPRKKCEKENKVMDLSKSAVDEISQMLARVYDLVETVSRDDGDLLDKAGVKVVAPAQRLLKITEITAPNINEARCQESLLSAIDHVSDEIENLKNTWTPMLQSPEYKETEEQLNKKLEIVNKTITALREACTENDDAEQQKKQEFTTSMSAAESALEEASRQLQDLSDSRLLTEGEGRNGSPELQSGLSQKLAHLNAAVAALIQATGDPHHSDYVEAQLAINIISQLTPDIIKDSKRLNGQVDQTTWKNIAEYLKDMLNATKDICANADNNESNESKTESLNDAVSQFANASGRLTYIYNPRKKCEKENKVMDLSKSAVDEISQMLARVYDLVETVSRDDGDLLDKAGVKVVAPAQRLLKITEITAPNINEARCQESLLSAIDHVSDEIENLKNTWTPMLQSPEYKEAEEQLNKKLEIVNKTITALREACTENDDAEQQKKQEFTTSMSAAESALEEASRQLQDLSDSRLLTEGEGRNGSPELQSGLSQKLAHLNAAVAALIQATGDPHHSDYVEAQLAINIISQLTPDIIKDSKRLNGQVDQTTWKNIAEYLKDMLNATKDICANADNNESNESKTESLNDAVSQFANASGRLTYIYNPRKKCEKENKVMDLSKSAVDEISQMLVRVYDLVETVSRDDGDLLDKAGVKVVAPAQRLLKITEITAPNINEARCQESLLSAIDHVSDEIENLKNTWTPMLQSPEYKEAEEQLNKKLEIVNKTITALREACTENDDAEQQKKQEFTTSMSAAESALEEASRQLQDLSDSRLLTEGEGRNGSPELQSGLSQKLAHLNAAVAALIQATGNPHHSDYVEAQLAINIISQLTPDIIKDSKRLNGQVDQTTWKNIAEYLKDMLNATKDICANADNNESNESKTESLNDAVSQFANASGRLTYIYNPRKKCEKENKVMDLSKSAVDEISQMLVRVYDLVETVSRDDGDLLDKAGVKVVAPAQRLLKITEITAPNINEARCQESLLSAIDHVSDEIENLKNTWTPMLQSPEYKEAEEQLNKKLEIVNKTITALREACTENDDAEQQKKQEFTTSMSAAESALEEASRQLQDLSDSRLLTEGEGRNGSPELQSGLSQKLAHLNAAVAALIQATGDPHHSDYVEAQLAINIISQLTPDIIKDSKRLNGQVDQTTWKNIAEYLKDMLNATKDICANADNNESNESKTESLNDAVSQFANASGRLTYIYNPRKKCEKENKVMDLSKSAVDEISQMLVRVYDLVETVSRDDGDLLDKAGVKVVAPAQRLLKITEITAPNINEARCQESLLSAIDHVSDEIENLKNTWTPMLQSPEYKEAEEQLNKKLEIVNKTITALREACTENDDAEQQKKQEFTTSMPAAESAFEEASRQLQDLSGSRLIGLAKTIEKEVTNNLPEIAKMVNNVRLEHRGQLQKIGDAFEIAVNQLHRTAELTAPSISNSQSQDLLLSAINDVTAKKKLFVEAWKPFLQNPKYIPFGEKFHESMRIVDTSQLEIAKTINELLSGAEAREYQQPDQLQTTVDTAKKAVYDLDKDLKDMIEKIPKARVDNVSLTKRSLAQKLGQLNAALASILIANTDSNVGRKISTVEVFSKLLSDIVKEAQHLHGTTDVQTWGAVTENIKTIMNASKVIYDSIQGNPENVDSAVAMLASSVAVLGSLCNKRTSSNKENQIQHLSRCAVEQISLLLPHVYHLAKTIGGAEGTELEHVGVKVVEGAKQLLKTAQITASTIDDPDCQEVLLSSVDHLKDLGQDLKSTWESIVQTPKNREIKNQLDHNLNLVNTTLEKIRNTCLGFCNNSKIQEKIQTLNIWEAKEKIKKAEKIFCEEQNAPELINKTEESTEKSVFEKRMQLTQKIAQMNEAVALLLQAMLDQKNPDYETIKKSVEVISNFTPDIIKESMALQVNLDDDSRQILFEETKSVCKATQEVFSSIENNSLEELLQGATKYAQSSGKLHHITSPHSHPNKERRVLELSRNVCERTSLLLSRLSRLAGVSDGIEGRGEGAREERERERAQELEAVGITVANAAHALLTSAHITAPSINEDNCQTVLLSSAERLSDLAQSLKNLCHPITENAEAQDIESQLQRDLTLLNKDIADLKTACLSSTENENVNLHRQTYMPLSEKLELESQLQETDHSLQDMSDTTISQGNDEDALIIEDTPLRQLAVKILETVKIKVKSNSLPQKEHKEMEKFSQVLSAAINALDLSNSRCISKPLDPGRRQDLELAVMDLQQICLLSKRGHAQNNVVDLTDYIDDVISAVHNFSTTADNVHLKSTDQGNEHLESLRNKCKEIQENENKLQNPGTLETDGGSIVDNMMRIDQFAKDCDDQVREMKSLVLKIDSESARNVLQDKLQYLTESCDLLRFAAKSSISSAASVEFEETIQNLEGVEKNIENILKTNENLNSLQENKMSLIPSNYTIQSAQTKLTAALLSGNENILPKELTRYAVTIQNDTALDDEMKLKDHLHNLIHILKLQTVAKSRLMATWQEVEDHDSIMMSKIFEELETFSRHSQKPGIETPMDHLIPDNDIRNMLLSNKPPVEGKPEELKRSLNKQIDKMSTVIQTIVLSFHKPEMLSRSLHMALGGAAELTATSKGLKVKDLLQNKRLEEATQEVKMATYNLVKTSESLSRSPVPHYRRKLMEACRSLNEALNKIVRSACPGCPEFSELQRDLQLAMQLGPQSIPAAAPLLHYAEQMQSQLDLINILRSSGDMTDNCRSQLRHITSSVCNSIEFGAQCAYLLSLSDEDKHMAQHGVIDRYRISKCTDAIQETCLQIICSGNGEQAKELESILNKQINQVQESLDDNFSKINNEQKEEILKQNKIIHVQFKEVQEALNSTTFREKEVTPRTFKLMAAIKKLNVQIEKVPRPKIDDSPKKKERTKEVTENMKKLINITLTMIKKASSCEEEGVTWENIGGNDMIQVLETLVSCVRRKGAEAGLIQSEEPEIPAKSYVQTQIALANTWLMKPASKEDKNVGVEAAESIIELAEKMCEDLGDGEKEELQHLIIETKQLLNDCTTKYNSEKASDLRERLQDVRKWCERGAVTRVVESFLHEPIHDIEPLVHEPDEKKRKFLLEKKIAELLEHLARVTKTARFVADTGIVPRQTLINTTDQVELLAPVLVKAAEKRISHLEDKVAIENYQKLLANYAESLTKVRDLCDRSVDPIDFSRAAGEIIHRIKEESSEDPLTSVHTSRVILKLGSRVVEAGLQAPIVRKDAELRRTLDGIKTALGRPEQMGDVAAEILKKTGEVESALGGENIFQKEPDSNQPIFAAALQLHASLRGWSARHNDAVHGAKLLAVLMARLSHYMDTGNKRELIITSKAIVDKSREIADIATKLAIECTDMRIRTNLLQVCERIPTISGQLKMLTTVKSSSLGQQGCSEDKESMNMLVGNAQNLMISIQEVVKAAESASVKIMSSQRGYRMKWVQRNYY